MRELKAIVMGSSAGGIKVLAKILSALPRNFPVPIAIVQHVSPDASGDLASVLATLSAFPVRDAEDKEPFLPGTAFLAPPDYHLLVERNATLSLSVDDKVWYSRPSIDVLFESAAAAFGAGVMGIILTGTSPDGAAGLKKIQEAGGITVVQEPEDAEAPAMPRAALETIRPEHVLPVHKIGPLVGCLGVTLSTEEEAGTGSCSVFPRGEAGKK